MPEVVTYRQVVMRLYLEALRCCRDYEHTWEAKRKLQLCVRKQFEKNRYVVDPERIDYLIAVARTVLNMKEHIEPYRPNNAVDSVMDHRYYQWPKKLRDHGQGEFKDIDQ